MRKSSATSNPSGTCRPKRMPRKDPHRSGAIGRLLDDLPAQLERHPRPPRPDRPSTAREAGAPPASSVPQEERLQTKLSLRSRATGDQIVLLDTDKVKPWT